MRIASPKTTAASCHFHAALSACALAALALIGGPADAAAHVTPHATPHATPQATPHVAPHTARQSARQSAGQTAQGRASAPLPLPAPLSADARVLSNRVRQVADNQGAPFLVLDKRAARVWVFDRRGRLRGSAPVLLGLAVGDDSVPGIGMRPLAQIQPFERTTPAGRFAIEAGRNLRGDDIFWIDYDAAVSMHRVRSVLPTERRLQRLASRTAADNRISFGCINVPVGFYNRVLNRYFLSAGGIAYVLPEVRSMASVFAFAGDAARRGPLASTTELTAPAAPAAPTIRIAAAPTTHARVALAQKISAQRRH